MIPILIPLAGVAARSAFSLIKQVQKSPIKNNRDMISVSRTADKFEQIVVNTSLFDDYANLLSGLPKTNTTTAITKNITEVSTVPTVTGTTSSRILDILNQSSKFSQENNLLLRRQVENLEVSNQLTSAKIFQDYETSVSTILAIENVAKELALTRQILEKNNTGLLDNIEKYFSEFGSFFNFQNTGIVKTGKDYFDREFTEKIKDSEGNEFVPAHAKAKKDIESLENLMFNKQGTSQLIDSNGSLIIPRNANALAKSEVSIDMINNNTFDWSRTFVDLIDDNEEDSYLEDLLKSLFKDIDITKIDSEQDLLKAFKAKEQ